ncbi:hypothetical protein GGR52DRAFT_586419 [Hypoxylon sp. FL1284]|nr:hypothetical protein GGR52DRAFT_586419 [Hypoxylon sp. FL1284]
MSFFLNRSAMSRAKRGAKAEAKAEVKAEAAESCDWRGDSPEPELDDLAHNIHHQSLQPDEACSWRGDSPEPEFDDLAHRSDAPNLSPRSPEMTHADPVPVDIEHLDTPEKDEKAPIELPHDSGSFAPCETARSQDSSGDGTCGAVPLPDVSEHEDEDEPDPSTSGKPSGEENDVPPETDEHPPAPVITKPTSPKEEKRKEKEKAKAEKEEAKKARREQKAKEKEERKEARKRKKEEHKEHCRRRIEKIFGKKMPASPTPDLPPGANGAAAADSHPQPDPHPGCRICQNSQKKSTVDLLRQSMENWQGVPSFHDLAEAAKALLGMIDKAEPQDAQEEPQGPSPEDQKLIDHIAEHIQAHFRGPEWNEDGHGETDKTSAYGLVPHPASSERRDTGGRRQESRDDGGATHHGLDGNGDWPVMPKRGHVLHSPRPASTTDFAISRPSSRGYSSMRASASPSWCEQLGFNIDGSISPPRRARSWSRRRFNSSPSRLRNTASLNGAHYPPIVYPETAMYACLPIPLITALCLESASHSHACCHYASPAVTPPSAEYAPHPWIRPELETISSMTSRRSISANEPERAF